MSALYLLIGHDETPAPAPTSGPCGSAVFLLLQRRRRHVTPVVPPLLFDDFLTVGAPAQAADAFAPDSWAGVGVGIY